MDNEITFFWFRNGILTILKNRPSAYSIPNGSSIHKLRTEDLVPISKKSFCFFLPHESAPAMAKVYVCKLGGLKML